MNVKNLSDSEKQVVHGEEKVVVVPNGLEPHILNPSNEKYSYISQKSPQQWHHDEKFSPIGEEDDASLKKQETKRKPSVKIWIGAIALTVVIVVLATVGGVLGSRRNNNTQPVEASPPPSESDPHRNSTNRNIAALTYMDGSESKTRLYYQDESDHLWEAQMLDNGAKWTTNELGVLARRGSPIAAAATPPGDSIQKIGLYYLNDSNVVQEQTWSDSDGIWRPGSLPSESFTADEDSSLSAMFFHCALCPNNTIVAFQDSDHVINIGNHSSTGWTTTQLGEPAEKGTGLALQPFYRTGQVDQINLYHQQQSSDSLALACGPYPWDDNNQVYAVAPKGAPIAAASSYDMAGGFEQWIQLLSLSGEGVRVDTWSGVKNDWIIHGAHPASMANGTSEEKTYKSLAVTAGGFAFAVVSRPEKADVIEAWQMEGDMLSWKQIGDVDIGDVWG